jgi:Ca2+-binding RTX toxin-like protein
MSEINTKYSATPFSDYSSPNNSVGGQSFSAAIAAGSGNDTVHGAGGNDDLNGFDGDDQVYGNEGDDTVRGGKGNDNVYGGKGNDSVHGDLGDDRLSGDRGDDFIDGGEGNDTASFSGSISNYTITREGSGFRVVDNRPGEDGSDFVTNVENFNFGGQNYSADGLIQAATPRQVVVPAAVAPAPVAADVSPPTVDTASSAVSGKSEPERQASATSDNAIKVTDTTPSNIYDIDALLTTKKWEDSSLKFALPTKASDYSTSAYDPKTSETATFAPVAGPLATAVRYGMAQIDSFTGLTITETTDNSEAAVSFGRSDKPPLAYASTPFVETMRGGDVWYTSKPGSPYDNPVMGNFAWFSSLHETGHAMGLEHANGFEGGTGDDVTYGGSLTPNAVSPEHDAIEYTVMSYRDYPGDTSSGGVGYEQFGLPQTFMMYDVAALQQLYGADFTLNNSDSTYTVSPTTGELSINDTGQGAPGANKVFRTIWDGGGNDTYDFSNYDNDLEVDLAPGGFSLISRTQQAKLGPDKFAQGNIYNALQYKGDDRSLIENAIGGKGNDTIKGNAAANQLTGGLGNDKLYGLGGDDTLTGGVGQDTLDGGVGNDTAFYSGSLSDYTVAFNDEGVSITDKRGNADGVDQVKNVENFTFADSTLSLGELRQRVG